MFRIPMSDFWAVYDSHLTTVVIPAWAINSIVLVVLLVALPQGLKPYFLPPFATTTGVFCILFIVSITRDRLQRRGLRRYAEEIESDSDAEIHQAVPLRFLPPQSPPVVYAGRPRLVDIKRKSTQARPTLGPVKEEEEEGSSPRDGIFVDVELGESSASAQSRR